MKKINIIVLAAVCAFVLVSCSKEAGDGSRFSEFSECILETVMESYEEGDISREDIAIDRIYYGHFSQKDADEILVLCKILNTPHVAGLDKTVAVLLKADSLEKTAYKEFNADNVTIDCIRTSIGQSRILFIGTTVYQGLLTQEIQFWGIQDGRWMDIPIENLETISAGNFCFMGDEEIIVSSITDHANIIAIFNWNPDEGKFLLN